MDPLTSFHPDGDYLNMQTLRPTPSKRKSPQGQNTEYERYITAWTSGSSSSNQRDLDTSLSYYNTGSEKKTPDNNFLNYKHNDDINNHNYYDINLDHYDTIKTPTHQITSKRRTWIITFIVVLVLILLIAGAILVGFLFRSNSSSDSTDSYLIAKPQYCTTEKSTEQKLACRRIFIKNMAISSFKAYRDYVWGAPELQPISKEVYVDEVKGNYPGLTIIDAMSTLWVMDLKEEWAEGRQWISGVMPNFADVDNSFRISEAVLDYLGGLLSAYFLSGEVVFLKKAKEVSEALKPAFHNQTGMLAYKFNPKGVKVTLTTVPTVVAENDTLLMNNKTQFENETTTKTTKPSTLQITTVDHQLSRENYLSNIGFQQPELIAISNLTNDETLKRHLTTNRNLMKNIKKFRGLYLAELDVTEGVWNSNWSLLNDASKDFFYNMPRSYLLLGNKNDNQLLEMYTQAMDSALAMGVIKRTEDGHRIYVKSFDKAKIWFHKSSYDDYCLLGGMFALSSEIFRKINSTKNAKEHLQLAVSITDTCRSISKRTKAKLLPYEFNDVEIFSNASSIS